MADDLLRNLVYAERKIGDRIFINEGEWYDGTWTIVEILEEEDAPEDFVFVQMKRVT